MANIKNKQNMTKFNIKTFVATSVLCVFFNGVIIYGAEGGENEIVIELNNGNLNNNEEVKVSENNKKEKPDNKKDFSGENKEKKKKFYHKFFIVKKGKDKCFPPYCYNYKGNFSLLFCFNFCNDPESNGEENPSFLKKIESIKSLYSDAEDVGVKLNDDDELQKK